MSERPKVSPDRAWKAINTMASEQEMDRIKALSDEDVEKELAAAGFHLDDVRSAGQEAIDKAAMEAGIRPPAAPQSESGSRSRSQSESQSESRSRSQRRRRAWFVVGIAAAATAIAAVVAAPEMVARFKHDEAAPNESDASPQRELTQEERATQLRDRALEECQARNWQPCLTLLDEAKKLDPAGETNPRIQSWRFVARNAERSDGAGVPRSVDAK